MIIDYNDKAQMTQLGLGAKQNNVFRLFTKKKKKDGDGFADACERVYWTVEGVDAYEGVTFRNVSNTSGCCTDFLGCTFKDCRSACSILDIDTRGEVSGCTFDAVTAFDEDGYIIHSVYEKIELVTDISNCRFINCQVGNADGNLSYCSYYKLFSTNKTVQVDNFDYESCEVEGNEKNDNSGDDHDGADGIGVLSELFKKRR